MNSRISEMTRPMRRLRLPAVCGVGKVRAACDLIRYLMMMMSFTVLSETKLGLPPYTCLGSVFATFFV
jgi:hypothetical protein